MKGYQHEFNSRNMSPLKITIKSFKTCLPKSSATVQRLRKASLSPMHLSPISRELNSPFNVRTVSDELHSVNSSKSPLSKQLTSLLSELDSSNFKKNIHPTLHKIPKKKYSSLADALFLLLNTKGSKASALTTVKLFITLGFSSDFENLSALFNNIFECDDISSIQYSKKEIINLCVDSKNDIFLAPLIKEVYHSFDPEKGKEFDFMVETVKKWWKKLDVSKNGFVPLEDVCRWFIERKVICSSSEARKVFMKLTPFVGYRQFFSVFSKPILKFLIALLAEIAKEEQANVPIDIAISSKRRRMIIEGLVGGNRVIETLVKCQAHMKIKQ